MKKKEKYLGEMLVSKKLITEDQLQVVIEDQSKSKKFLGEILVEKEFITEKELYMTIAEQFSVEFVFLKDQEIDWDVAIKFSSFMVAEHKALPLKVDGETLVVAITNPLNVDALDAVERKAASLKIKVVVVTVSDMDAAIKEYRQHSIKKMINKWKND